MITNKSVEKSKEVIQNLMEIGGTTNFSFLQKHSANWFPTLTRIIFKELRDIYELDNKMIDINKNIKHYMTLLPPEKLSLLTIQTILRSIVLQVVDYKKEEDRERGNKIWEENERVYVVTIRHLIEDLGRNLVREIFFLSKVDRFRKLLEEQKEELVFENKNFDNLSDDQKKIKWKNIFNYKIKKYSKKLTDFMNQNHTKDFNDEQKIMPDNFKLQIASHLLYMGPPFIIKIMIAKIGKSGQMTKLI